MIIQERIAASADTAYQLGLSRLTFACLNLWCARCAWSLVTCNVGNSSWVTAKDVMVPKSQALDLLACFRKLDPSRPVPVGVSVSAPGSSSSRHVLPTLLPAIMSYSNWPRDRVTFEGLYRLSLSTVQQKILFHWKWHFSTLHSALTTLRSTTFCRRVFRSSNLLPPCKYASCPEPRCLLPVDSQTKQWQGLAEGPSGQFTAPS